jgi:two-component system NtrC family sensor kinase
MKKSSLLVVDDSAHLHRLVKAYLQGDAVEVLSAFSGKDALDAAAHLQPDLILLDIDMPGMNGFEVCRKLK